MQFCGARQLIRKGVQHKLLAGACDQQPERTPGRFFDVENVDQDTFSAEELKLIIGDLRSAERKVA